MGRDWKEDMPVSQAGDMLMLHHDHPHYRVIRANWVGWTGLHLIRGVGHLTLAEVDDKKRGKKALLFCSHGHVFPDWGPYYDDLMAHVRAWVEGADCKEEEVELSLPDGQTLSVRLTRMAGEVAGTRHWASQLSFTNGTLDLTIPDLYPGSLRKLADFLTRYVERVEQETDTYDLPEPNG